MEKEIHFIWENLGRLHGRGESKDGRKFNRDGPRIIFQTSDRTKQLATSFPLLVWEGVCVHAHMWLHICD